MGGWVLLPVIAQQMRIEQSEHCIAGLGDAVILGEAFHLSDSLIKQVWCVSDWLFSSNSSKHRILGSVGHIINRTI